METKTKKTTMIGAALAVAIIALAGAGYALTYTATTSNTDNDLAATYVKLSQTGTARYDVSSFLTDVYFNTVDKGPSTAANYNQFEYTVVNTHYFNTTYTAANDNNAAQLNCALAGKGITLDADMEGTAPGSVVLVVEATSGLNVASGLTYKMVIGTETSGVITVTDTATLVVDSETGAKTWTFTALTLTQDTSWNLFLFIDGTTTVAPATGFASQDVVFDFTLTATPPTTPATP